VIDRDVVISDLGSIRKPDSLAEMADFLIRIEGVKWALCLGEFRGSIYFSFRTTTRKGNAGLIARKMVQGIGSGGGHHMTAAGRVEFDPHGEGSGRTKTELLIARFLKEIKQSDVKGEKL
jgi:nanoRNase/pAp phosphatase (c-di-AMP/oligoRNAs hydrolase)